MILVIFVLGAAGGVERSFSIRRGIYFFKNYSRRELFEALRVDALAERE